MRPKQIGITLEHLDGTKLEVIAELTTALEAASIITRNGRYYTFTRSNTRTREPVLYAVFREVLQPYAVPF